MRVQLLTRRDSRTRTPGTTLPTRDASYTRTSRARSSPRAAVTNTFWFWWMTIRGSKPCTS
eukprot:5706411-Pleurochrysis_carterae.AAC.2